MDVARCALLALNFLLLSSQSYLLATALVTLLNIALVVIWDFAGSGEARWKAAVAGPLAIAIVATLVLFTACHAWLHEILIRPHDWQRADMLVVVQLGMRRLLHGNNPYMIYDVPWPAPLPYGIVMWAPMLILYLLHADVRFATIAGALFVPAACAIAAVAEARLGRFTIALAWLATMATVAFNVPMRDFIAIGHTPMYWPLLALFAWLVARERWYAAALACGLLIVARTTMVSIAPVFLIAVWHNARPRFAGCAALLTAGLYLPFLPFAVADWTALRYALYGQLPERDEDLRVDLHHLGAAYDRPHRVAPLARLARRRGTRPDRCPAGGVRGLLARHCVAAGRCRGWPWRCSHSA